MFEQLKEILADVLGIESDTIKLESKLEDDLGLDSLDALDIATQIEEKLDKKIPDEEFMNFVTVKDINDYLEK